MGGGLSLWVAQLGSEARPWERLLLVSSSETGIRLPVGLHFSTVATARTQPVEASRPKGERD